MTMTLASWTKRKSEVEQILSEFGVDQLKAEYESAIAAQDLEKAVVAKKALKEAEKNSEIYYDLLDELNGQSDEVHEREVDRKLAKIEKAMGEFAAAASDDMNELLAALGAVERVVADMAEHASGYHRQQFEFTKIWREAGRDVDWSKQPQYKFKHKLPSSRLLSGQFALTQDLTSLISRNILREYSL